MAHESERQLRLRYAAKCNECGLALSPGTEAVWNRESKQATCLACANSGVTTVTISGPAGASAAAEGARRSAGRVEWVRQRHGDNAAAVAEQVAAREQAQTWAKGSSGETLLAAFVERELGAHVIALHDRVIPGTKRNIDHIFIAPTGVWVVDAKAYQGRVAKRDVGPFWREENKVYVGGRDRSKLVRGVEAQVESVLTALGLDPNCKGTEIHAALCFVESDWGLFNRPFQVGSAWVLYPGALAKRLKKNGPLSRAAMERAATAIALGLPPAT